MIELDPKYQPILLEAIEELMYKISLQLDDMKGGPLDRPRKELTQKQHELEKIQHIISTANS